MKENVHINYSNVFLKVTKRKKKIKNFIIIRNFGWNPTETLV